MDVDELTASLASSVSFNDPGIFAATSPHPRFANYKNSNWIKNSQQRRREEMLEKQKTSRFNLIQKARGQDDRITIDKKQWYTRNKKNEAYANQLMHSEWLVDVPYDLASNWYMVPCPLGRRCFIVATEGFTYCFSKTGYERHRFLSHLPGGNRRTMKNETKLDCVLSESNSTLYILDCIDWKGQHIGESDRAFRYFWLMSMLEEIPELGQISDTNKFRFVLLPQYSCNEKSIELAINLETEYEIDGLLFYCNHAYYEPGLTPLVGWLKPFMLREILNIEHLPPKYEAFQDPSKDHVTTAAEFIEEFNAKVVEQKSKRNGGKIGAQES